MFGTPLLIVGYRRLET